MWSTQAMNASRSSFGNSGSRTRCTIDAVAILDGLQPPAAAGDDVHLVAVADELLGQLAHVPREAALDDRRVLPREGQNPHGLGPYRHVRCAPRRPPTHRPSRRSSRPRARHSLPYLPMLHTDDEDHAFFAGVVAASGVTVAELDGEVVGVPRARRRQSTTSTSIPTTTATGSAARCCAHAQAARAAARAVGLPAQPGAIAFYEAHGFAIVESTDGADNEEHEPDYRMAWPTMT